MSPQSQPFKVHNAKKTVHAQFLYDSVFRQLYSTPYHANMQCTLHCLHSRKISMKLATKVDRAQVHAAHLLAKFSCSSSSSGMLLHAAPEEVWPDIVRHCKVSDVSNWSAPWLIFKNNNNETHRENNEKYNRKSYIRKNKPLKKYNEKRLCYLLGDWEITIY